MKRPARVAGRHPVLRAVHTLLRLVLVCALLVLLTLIAVREVAGITAAANPARSTTGASSRAPAATTPSAPPTTPPATAALIPPSGAGE